MRFTIWQITEAKLNIFMRYQNIRVCTKIAKVPFLKSVYFTQYPLAGPWSRLTNSSPRVAMPRWTVRPMVSPSLRSRGRRQQVERDRNRMINSDPEIFRKQTRELQRPGHSGSVQCESHWRGAGSEECAEGEWRILSVQGDQWNWTRTIRCYLHQHSR